MSLIILFNNVDSVAYSQPMWLYFLTAASRCLSPCFVFVDVVIRRIRFICRDSAPFRWFTTYVYNRVTLCLDEICWRHTYLVSHGHMFCPVDIRSILPDCFDSDDEFISGLVQSTACFRRWYIIAPWIVAASLLFKTWRHLAEWLGAIGSTIFITDCRSQWVPRE